MLGSRSTWTILFLTVLACLPVVSSAAPFFYFYVDDPANNDIWRYKADGTPAPATGQSGAVFCNMPDGHLYQYHKIAYSSVDNYIYISSPYDRYEQMWSPGSNCVTRIEKATGMWDPGWKVMTGVNTNAHNALVFAPDGTLYSLNAHPAIQNLCRIDIPSQTASLVYTDTGYPLSISGMQAVAFGANADAYVSVTGTENKVFKYNINPSTGIWTRDTSYNGSIGGATPGEMVYNPNDGFLYVNDWNVTIYRLNSAGVMDEISPGAPWKLTGIPVAGEMEFAPNGNLYVAGYTKVSRWDVSVRTGEILQSMKCSGIAVSNPIPTVGASNRGIVDAAAMGAAPGYHWVTWGEVSERTSSGFRLDDGSGVFITVSAEGNTVSDGDYVSVKGMVTLGPLILTCDSIVVFRSSPVSVVRDGEIRAVVVTAANPSEVAAYAAQELVDHIEMATGERLPIAVETSIPSGYASRIFVGDTQAARNQGIVPENLDPDEFVLRTVGSSDLYILGKELPSGQQYAEPPLDPADPLSLYTEHSGTMFGVYEVLDRYLGVRWLWPGELGTYVPRTSTVEIPHLEETVIPQVLHRLIGTWWVREMGLTGSWSGERRAPVYGQPLTEEVVKKLVFPTEDAGYAYGKAMETHIRRHRMAFSLNNRVAYALGHVMAGVADWWATYGAAHPAWFALQADGLTRGPVEGEYYSAICVTNTELHDKILELWNGSNYLALIEADVSGDSYCHCQYCLAWDGPQPTGYPAIVGGNYTPRVVSGRYAQFWKTIYDRAVLINPNVKVAGFLYFNILPAPLTNIELNENIHGSFVIYGAWNGWYPMSEEEAAWYRQQWLGWKNTGMKLIDRSNYLLNNYTTPYLTTWQAGDFWKFCYDNGKIGVNLESYNFAWAAQGPMAYMYHRLIDKPEKTIGNIRQEYFSAFGPAASYVEQYFDYWENYARTREPISSVETGDTYGALEKLRRPMGHYLAYPPEVYAPAQALLNSARAAALADPLPEYAQRVEFLQKGLDHALLSTRVYEFLDYDYVTTYSSVPMGNPTKLRQARQAMQELIQFRMDPANLYVSDYMSNARSEQGTILNFGALLVAPDDEPPPVHPSPPYFYVDDPANNDIWRYNADGTPAPATGQSGAVFCNLPDGYNYQYHGIAYSPVDNYIYISSPYDRYEQMWSPGSNYVTRIEKATGKWDPDWKAMTGVNTNAHNESLAFAPDGTLYALNAHPAIQNLCRIDIPSQTASPVYADTGSRLSISGMQAVAFGANADAYVSVTGTENRVFKYNINTSTGIWTRDTSYNGSIGGATPRNMVYNDGFLYVNDWNAAIYRLNSAGVMDEISPGAPWKLTGIPVAGDMVFAPDGKLYVAGYTKLSRWNITTRTYEVLMSMYCSGADFSPF